MNVDHARLLGLLAPECLVVFTALAALFADLRFWKHRTPGQRSHRTAIVLTLGFGAAATLLGLMGNTTANLAGGTLVLSPLSQHLKIVLLLFAIVTAWLCTETRFTRHVGEFMALLGLATAGMMFLVGTENLLMVFVALELVSLSLYAMTAFDKRSPRSAEAALRYFLFGGTAAAFTLFGFSLFYGVGGSIHLPTLAVSIARHAGDPLVLVAIVFVLAGFGFKIAAVPFHAWAPDAYEGAPAPTAAFIASGSKIAGFLVLGKLLQVGLPAAAGSGAWKAFAPGWMAVVALLAAASMVFGNLAALAQTNLRRLLAYSAIAHAGYALLALVGGSQPALLYFVVTYALAVVGMFGVVAVVENRTGNGSIAGLAGLRERSPLLAGVTTVFLLSLAGIPPLAGFLGKFLAFVAAAKQGTALGYGWLVALALGMSCVSLYYYLQVLKQVWVVPAETRDPLRGGTVVGGLLAALAVAVVVAGCMPEPLLDFLR
ncbi:MAG: NADH-quinone oxidoreductase subunit N [Verrucomicrobia bacterium]|nr:MAG: NADH-quinone oxidoreductase subunit N [Verrucomicrobiota bacterium]